MRNDELLFGDIVVVEENLIGVIVKSWKSSSEITKNYDVYVRELNAIKNYDESQVRRYRVRHKYLSGEELEWQNS